MGVQDIKYNKVPLFGQKKTGNINTSMSAAHKTSSCASKSLLLRCNLVIPQCMCQVSLRLKEVQMGAHNFKYNKVPIFARKTGNINTSMFAVPKLALVPASRYNCNVTLSYHNVCAKFH